MPTSIVITCFNQARFLARSIESALAQTAEVDLVVIDDGSSDGTRDICLQYPAARYCFQQNRGLPAARNAGLREALGDTILFLDADDVLLPDGVAIGIKRLTGRPSVAFTSGEHRYIDDRGRIIGEWTRTVPTDGHYEALLRGNYVGMGATVLFRTAVVRAVGGFDVRLCACEDYDLYLRIARSHEVDAHTTVVAEYRRHDQNMSADSALMLRSALRVLQGQVPHAASSAATRTALDEGMRYWERYYGVELSLALRRDPMRPRLWAKVGGVLLWLVVTNPASASRLLRILATSSGR